MSMNITDTFVHPCLTCGTTVHVVGGEEQPHECPAFATDESPAAYAWWQGREAAIAYLLACRRCGREHQDREIEPATKYSGPTMSWADPDDGHAYEAVARQAGALLRGVADVGAPS